MSHNRLDAILNELLSEEDEDSDSIEEDVELDLGLSLGTRLFDDDELEAVLSSCADTPQESSDRQPTTIITLTPETAIPSIPATAESVISLSDHQTTPETTNTRNLSELDLVEESVRNLVNTGDSERTSTVLDRLKDKLKKSEDDWNPEGRPNAYGGMIGGSISLCTASLTQPIANSLQNEARYGTTQVLSQTPLRGTNTLTAVGTSRGMLIVQLSLTNSQGSEDFELFELGDARFFGTITCVACSPFSEKDRLLLAVGNAEGQISVWDVMAKKCVSTITSHSLAVCCLSFFATKASSMLLSSDIRGAFHSHALTSWLGRLSVSTRVLSEGNRQPLMFRLSPSMQSATEDPDDPSNTSDSKRTMNEGMICLCHPNVCSIGRISPEGRLTVFYQIPKPVEIASDVIPIVSWAPLGRLNYAPHQHPDIDGFIPYGAIALCWMNELRLLNVPLLGDPSHADPSNIRRMPVKLEASDFIRLAHEMPIQSFANWDSEEEEGSFIVDSCWLSIDRLAVLRKRGMLSQVLLFDGNLKLMDQVELDDTIIYITIRPGMPSLTTMQNAVTVITPDAQLTVVGSNGLKVCKLLEWEEAIAVLNGIGKWLMALHLLAAFHSQATNVNYDQNVGIAQLGVRDLDRINQRMCNVLLQLLDESLVSIPSEEVDDIEYLAELAMEICILANQPKVLFDEVFPRFVSSEGKEVFLQKLEQSLSSNELTTGIPPEAMQALVEYCCKIGEPEKVERCVLRMDIASLDLNQVIPLCIGHHLFIALLYIFNNSLLRDCTTPALYLVNAIVLTEDKDKAREYGMNLLLYIRCCLRGEPYPPGFADLDQDNILLTKQKVLGFMLFTTVQDLKKASEVMLRDSRKEGIETSFSEAFLKLCDPYPVLQCLLSVNASILVGLLSEALESWECVEKDLLEAYTHGKVEEMESVRSVTQVIVDALVGLLERFPEDKEALLNYICRCVASGKAVVSSNTALLLLEHLSIISQRNDTNEYVETIEEKLFCGIVKSVGIELQSTRKSTMMFTYLEGQKALGLATNANLISASALLHHLFQDYESALRHYLLVGRTLSTRPFTYFEKSVAQFLEYNNNAELDKLKKAALSFMSELASLNPEFAAAMVMRHFPKDQEAVIQGLHGSRTLLFKYLRSAMDTALSKVLSNLDIELSSDSNQLLTKSHCTLYVSLMCEYDQSSVLPFLQSYDRLVDVQVCKQDCLRFGLHDAAAYLLERECDIIGALKILIEKIQNVHKSLEKTIVVKGGENLLGPHSRQLSLAAILRVSESPDERLREFPEDVRQAQSALSSAVNLCRKNSLMRDKRSSVDEKRRTETLQLWFSLLIVYIDALRDLPRLMKKRLKETSHSSIASQKSLPLKPVDQFKDYPRLAYLRDIYNALMDEVITAMADYVPLVDVAEVVISEHAADKFGDFRSTLLGLISAYNHEHSILTSIRRLLSVDAYHVLNECYKKRTEALPIDSRSPRTSRR